MIWIQHSEIRNYYESFVYGTPASSPKELRPNAIKSIEKAEMRIKPTLTNTSVENDEEIKRIHERNGYRYLRSSSQRYPDPSKNTSTSNIKQAKELLRRVSTLGRRTRSNSLSEFSVLKGLTTSEKQKLCQADIILFSLIQDDANFPLLTDESKASSVRFLKRLRKRSQWPIENTKFVHRILFRNLYKRNKNYLNNLPTQNKKRDWNRRGKKTLPETDYMKISVQTDTGSNMTRALPCIVHEYQLWYIADGFIEEQYFTAEKITEAETFEITGLLVPIPEIESKGVSEQSDLEKNFRKSQKWVGKCVQDSV